MCSHLTISVSVCVSNIIHLGHCNVKSTDSLTKKTKTKLTILSKGDNVIIPIPSVDRGHADERNIKGVVMNVNEHGGYKIGIKVGQIKGKSNNQKQKKHTIQHAYITTFCTLPFHCYMTKTYDT
jgi:hypothetical protein